MRPPSRRLDKNMKNIRRLLSLGALALMYVGISAADTISYSATFGPSTTDFTHTFALTDFNSALGVLSNVTITLNASEDVSQLTIKNIGNIEEDNFSVVATSSIKGQNNTAVAADNITAFSLTDFDSTVGFPGGMTLHAAGGPVCPIATPSATCSTVDFTPPDLTDANAKSKSDSTAAILAYILGSTSGQVGTGTGSFNIDGVTQAFTSFSGGGGNIQLTQLTNATITATVTYTYSVPGAPEPATLFLMGSALVGVGLLRKRIKA